MADYPTPEELLTAHQTLGRLARAVLEDKEWSGRIPSWEAVVEAKMRLAQVTSALGEDYGEVWERMAGGG